MLIFVGGDCVKRISGDAVPDVPGATVLEDTPQTAVVPVRLVKLVAGVATVVQEDPVIVEARAGLDLATKKIFLVALNHENRIRLLEGKAAVTAAQFKTALTSL